MNRYYVEPCDNCGTVAGLKRDRTWLVMDRETGKQVSEHDTRELARREMRASNAVERQRRSARVKLCEADQIAGESMRGEVIE